MPRLLFAALFAVAALVLACGDVDLDALGERGSSSARQSARVERVVDGDTVVLSGLGKARLIGVDTPVLRSCIRKRHRRKRA